MLRVSIFCGLTQNWGFISLVFSSSGPKDPMSLCHGVASVVRPSFRPSTVFKMFLLRHFSTDFDSDCFIR